jgi:hypothetical protein
MRRIVRILASTLAVSACAQGAFAAVTMEPLCIRIYDTAGTAIGDRARVLKSASDILAGADVKVDWRDCSPRAARPHPACQESPKAGELVVRLVRLPDSGGTRALGEAFIDSVTGQGVLATVFIDRIEQFAAQAKADAVTIVGRVLAHEIGHLLLGTTSHAAAGLMRESWSTKDLAENRRQDWLFSRLELDRLRQSRMRTS